MKPFYLAAISAVLVLSGCSDSSITEPLEVHQVEEVLNEPPASEKTVGQHMAGIVAAANSYNTASGGGFLPGSLRAELKAALKEANRRIRPFKEHIPFETRDLERIEQTMAGFDWGSLDVDAIQAAQATLDAVVAKIDSEGKYQYLFDLIDQMFIQHPYLVQMDRRERWAHLEEALLDYGGGLGGRTLKTSNCRNGCWKDLLRELVATGAETFLGGLACTATGPLFAACVTALLIYEGTEVWGAVDTFIDCMDDCDCEEDPTLSKCDSGIMIKLGTGDAY